MVRGNSCESNQSTGLPPTGRIQAISLCYFRFLAFFVGSVIGGQDSAASFTHASRSALPQRSIGLSLYPANWRATSGPG
jgi:hypothetical protein